MNINKQYRVLILDNGLGAWQSIADIENEGFNVVETSSFEEAQKKLEEDQPALFLFHLPDDSFNQWFDKGKNAQNTFDHPVIFIVDSVNDERFEKIRQSNAFGFVSVNDNSHTVLQILNLAVSRFENGADKEQKNELNTLATTFSAATGREFFNNVCEHICESLGVDYAYIGEIINENGKVKVHSIYGEGEFRDSFEYSLEDTPCANVAGQESCSYKSGVQDLFPNDELLQKMEIDGYIGVPLFSSSGNPLGIVVLLNKKPLEDVSRCQQYLQIYSTRVSKEMERIRAEAELREREEELRSINAHISEGIYRSTPEDGLVYVNDAFANMFGYESPEELLSVEGVELYADEDRRKELTEIENRDGYIKNEEVEFRRKDGSTFWGLMSGQVVYGDNGEIKYYDGSVLDITERKHALDENRRLLEAIQQSPEEIIITNAKGHIEYVNPRFLEENSSKEEELLDSVAPILDENELTAPFYDELWETVQNGEVWTRTVEKESEDGDTIWEEVSISPVFNKAQEITNYVIINKNITERKERENKLQDSLLEKEILLAEIHHRVKNNLAIISGLLELAAQNKGSDNGVKSIFQESQLRIQSMAMVHEKLYQAGNFTNLKIENYITELVDFIQNTFDNENKIDVTIENSVDVQLNINQAIPCALMINELVTNAFKHAFNEIDDGKLNIKLKPDGDNILLVVQDNGPGLPDGFEKQSQNSLGFVLIKQLTKQLQGELTIKNENGARFEIFFKKTDQTGSSGAGYIIDRKER